MIWLIGCKGMLGTEVARQLDEKKMHWIGTDRECDITDPAALEAFVKSTETAAYFPSELSHAERQIRWIINCSAYTNVDNAEDEPERARALNAEGPLNVARIARKIGAKLIHISTDYVFDGSGTRPYTEDSEKSPLGVYGRTKAEGEDAIQKEMTQFYILRTAWLYGFDGRNFVYTMTRLMNQNDSIKVVSDQKGTPTCAVDLAGIILKLITKSDGATSFFGRNSAPSYGIYHFTDDGEASWYDFAREIYALGRKHGRITQACVVNACASAEYPVKAARPAYSVLDKTKITRELKLKIPDWKTSLEKFMKDRRFAPEN